MISSFHKSQVLYVPGSYYFIQAGRFHQRMVVGETGKRKREQGAVLCLRGMLRLCRK
ncbi:hypothetical protein HMPREF3038_01448 [Akkermansia sp. KLE1797]|nr:hypothetical protein HMPREF3038_01448 [Akkermansia sp. KLE1797]KZA03451.1 hypothetical protein HMPREF1326_02880 [Akkermansia sp. KLE1605]